MLFHKAHLRTHRVAPGEDLMQIARRYYGARADKRYALSIYRHNRDLIENYNHLQVGTELIIPHFPEDDFGGL